jgi:hypothetical protein
MIIGHEGSLPDSQPKLARAASTATQLCIKLRTERTATAGALEKSGPDNRPVWVGENNRGTVKRIGLKRSPCAAGDVRDGFQHERAEFRAKELEAQLIALHRDGPHQHVSTMKLNEASMVCFIRFLLFWKSWGNVTTAEGQVKT